MSFVCSICGKAHEGLQAVAYLRPQYWLGLTPEQQSQGKIDQDLCATFDGHSFVRCALRLPLTDGPERTLEFGPWSSLSEKNFWRYVETFQDPEQSKIGDTFGWLSNEIKGFPASLNLSCRVEPQDNNQRPLILVDPSDHPLSVAQRAGISFEQALRIAHEFQQ